MHPLLLAVFVAVWFGSAVMICYASIAIGMNAGPVPFPANVAALVISLLVFFGLPSAVRVIARSCAPEEEIIPSVIPAIGTTTVVLVISPPQSLRQAPPRRDGDDRLAAERARDDALLLFPPSGQPPWFP